MISDKDTQLYAKFCSLRTTSAMSIKNIVRFENSSYKMLKVELKITRSDLAGSFKSTDEFDIIGTEGHFRFWSESINNLSLQFLSPALYFIDMEYTTILLDANGKFIFGNTGFTRKFSLNIDLLEGFTKHLGEIMFSITIKCEFMIKKDEIGEAALFSIQNTSEENTSAQFEKIVKEVVKKAVNYGQAPVDCLQELSVNFKKLLDEAIGTDVTIHVDSSSMKARKMMPHCQCMQCANASVPVQSTGEKNASAHCENMAKEGSSKTDNHGQAPTECLQELSIDFKKLLDESIGTDVTIHVEGSSIKAHKAILRARSPVFEKMFDHDTSEAVQNEIDIKDISASTMKELLTFLYTGTKEDHAFDDACDLYYAADKYEVLSLRNACKEDLMRQLCVDNACQGLILAANHGDEILKRELMEYIRSNFETIVSSKSFEELTKHDPLLSLLLTRNHMLSKSK